MKRNVRSENSMMKRALLATAMLGVVAGTASTTRAGLVAGFDYGTSSSPVQADFTRVSDGTAGVTTTTGNGIGISKDTTSSGTRDRGAKDDPLTDLVRDLHFISGSDPVTFTLSGLAPNTTYNVTAYAYDSESGNNGKILEWTTNGGTVTHTTNSSDPSSAAFALAPMTTDASGEATITGDHVGGAGGGVLLWNGFEISFDEPVGTMLVLY